MSRWTGQPWLALHEHVDNATHLRWPFWRRSIIDGRVGYNPTRLNDIVLRAVSRTGWAICQRRGHLFAGEWRYSLGGNKAHRWCVRCLSERQEGTYETEATPSGQMRITKVTATQPT